MTKGLLSLLIVLTVAGSGCFFDTRAIRGGETVKIYNLAEYPFPIEEVYYRDLDGTLLYAWFIKRADFSDSPTIIFLHGAKGNLHDHRKVIENLYNATDANIFACDFPGTGASEGKMNLENTYAMTLAAIDYVIGLEGIRTDRVILYGLSMGAALAFYGGAKREGIPIIADSGVTSASDFVRKYVFVGLPDFVIDTFGENFNNYLLVKNMKNPKLFLHGIEDRIIDVANAQRLYKTASEPKDCLWLHGNHVLLNNNENRELLTQKIRSFIGTYVPK